MRFRFDKHLCLSLGIQISTSSIGKGRNRCAESSPLPIVFDIDIEEASCDEAGSSGLRSWWWRSDGGCGRRHVARDTRLTLNLSPTRRRAGLRRGSSRLSPRPRRARTCLQPSYGLLGRAVARRRHGLLDADIVIALAGTGYRRARRKGLVSREMGSPVVPRHRASELRRRLRPPRRQPQEGQGLERPAPARRRRRDHAEPLHPAAIPLEHPGRVWRVAACREDREAGEDYLLKFYRNMSVQDKIARRVATRRSPRARATSCSRTRTRPFRPLNGQISVRHPAADDADRVHSRRARDEREQGDGGAPSSRFLSFPAAAASSPRTATAR